MCLLGLCSPEWRHLTDIGIPIINKIWSDDRLIFIIGRPSLHLRHNGHDSVSNHQPHGCLLNRLFTRRSKKISKLRVTGLCAGNSPETGEFPAQIAINAENVSIYWRHHGLRFIIGILVPVRLRLLVSSGPSWQNATLHAIYNFIMQKEK